MKINHFAKATFATLLLGSPLVAQQPPANSTTQATSNAQQKGTNSLTKDQTLARCLAIADQEQVMLCRFAKETVTSDEVKNFAGTLEKAHQGCLEQLKAISPQTGSVNNASTTTAKTPGNDSASVDFLQLHQEISTQCLKDSQEYLSEKKGVEFDKCFVGMQIAKHAGMHSTLTVLQRQATGKLQGLIKDGLETNKQHMEAAVNLMEKLAANEPTKISQTSK